MSNSPRKVLVVEDDPALQEVYVMIFSSSGFDVTAASNGEIALKELQRFVPDVILLDYFMPVMDGKAFLKEFKRESYPETKVLLATNISDKTVLNEMLSLGADSYVIKAGMSPTELVTAVESL